MSESAQITSERNRVTVNPEFPNFNGDHEQLRLLVADLFRHSSRVDSWNSLNTVDCDATNKVTLGCQCCIAHILSGTSKTDGNKLSILSHITPGCLTEACFFREAYAKVLKRMRSEVIPESVSSGIVGGYVGTPSIFRNYRQEYRRLAQFTAEITRVVLRIPTYILARPKLQKGDTDVFHSTSDDQTVVLQNDGGALPEPIPVADIESHMKQWWKMLSVPGRFKGHFGSLRRRGRQ